MRVERISRGGESSSYRHVAHFYYWFWTEIESPRWRPLFGSLGRDVWFTDSILTSVNHVSYGLSLQTPSRLREHENHKAKEV